MATRVEFSYNIQSLINKTQADVIDYVKGRGMDLKRDLLYDEEMVHVKRWLQQIAADMFVILHKKGYGITNSYQWDVEVDGEEGRFIIYTVDIPDDVDTNLIQPIDTAIEEAIILNMIVKYLSKRAIYDQDKKEEATLALDKIRNLINFKTSISKTYNWY